MSDIEQHLRRAFAVVFPNESFPDPGLAVDFLIAEVILLREAGKAVNRGLRPFAEVQRAHDMLVSLLLGELLQRQLPEDVRPEVSARADVLCWCLSHDHNARFANELKILEEHLKNAGITFYDSGVLQYPNQKSN